LFILPTDLKRTSGENEEVYFSIVEEVKKQVSIPVSVKTSFYFSNLLQMLTRLSETGIRGLVLFNRYYSPDIDIDNLQVTSGNILSHPEDLLLTLRWIGIMSGRVSCDLAATTGIHEGKDLVKVLLAGADAAQVASVFYQKGFVQASKILKDLEAWMKLKSFKSISDFRGLLNQPNVNNPAAYERVQFMKYFRGYKHTGIV
jgi:dihydroorotate dehydrogenase (fumarate)